MSDITSVPPRLQAATARPVKVPQQGQYLPKASTASRCESAPPRPNEAGFSFYPSRSRFILGNAGALRRLPRYVAASYRRSFSSSLSAAEPSRSTPRTSASLVQGVGKVPAGGWRRLQAVGCGDAEQAEAVGQDDPRGLGQPQPRPAGLVERAVVAGQDPAGVVEPVIGAGQVLQVPRHPVRLPQPGRGGDDRRELGQRLQQVVLAVMGQQGRVVPVAAGDPGPCRVPQQG